MDNITCTLDESYNSLGGDELGCWHIHELLKDFEEIKVKKDRSMSEDEDFFTDAQTYLENTVKQLLVICEYYGLTKVGKMKKEDLVYQIVSFEHNYENIAVVMRRKELWHYMEQLKNDKIMKRFVLW